LTADWLHSRLVPELILLTGSARSALAAGYLFHGGMSGIRVVRRRSISKPAVPCWAHGSRSGTRDGHRRSIHEVETAAYWQQLAAADRLSSGSSVGAEPAIDLLGRLRVTANWASSCLHRPGPGDENAGPLALTSTDLPIVAADIVGLPGVATIPMMGTGGEEPLALADDEPHMTGNRHCYLVATGCPANGSCRMFRSPGCLLRHPPGPGTEPCGQ